MVHFKEHSIYRGKFNTESEVVEALRGSNTYTDEDSVPVCIVTILRDIAVQTHAICIEAVRILPMTLQYINERFQTTDIVLEAVSRDPRALRYASEITYDTIRAALDAAHQRSPNNNLHEIKDLILRTITEYCPDPSLYIDVIRLFGSGTDYASKIPSKHYTDELLVEMIARDPQTLSKCREFITVDIVRAVTRRTDHPSFYCWSLVIEIGSYFSKTGDGVYDDESVRNILTHWPRQEYPETFVAYIMQIDEYRHLYNKMKLVRG